MSCVHLLASLAAGLLLPSSGPQDSAKRTASRRVLLETAAGTALLPLLALPNPANAVRDIDSEIGFDGKLRSNIPASIKGDGVEIIVTDQTYKELTACPPNFFVPERGGPWSCLEITVTAANNGRRKKTTGIDIFGLLFDAEGFACGSWALSSDTKGSPATSLEINIPKGESRQVTFNAAVQARSPRPFRFGGWKGAYRAGGITKTFQAFDDCEVDSSKCEEGEDQPENAAAGYLGKGNTYRKGDLQ